MEAQRSSKRATTNNSSDDLEHLSMADIEAAMTMSVSDAIFTSVLSKYPVGAHIQCRCQVSDPADLAAGCWVGLFKVGWASPEADCVCRAECRRESDRVLVAVFSPGQLPRDGREFYQFCFAAPGGLVKGASTPFLFSPAPTDDFVAEMDEELQSVVVSARTAQLESELAAMRLEKAAQRSAAEDASERLSAELAELAERLSDAEARAARAEAEAERRRAELDRQEAWRQSQAARLVDAEDERRQLLRRLEEATRDAESAGDQAEAARQSLELHAAERQRLTEELQACRRRCDQLDGELRAVSGELEAAMLRERSAEQAKAAAEAAAVAALTDQVAQRDQEIQQLRSEAQQSREHQAAQVASLQERLHQSEQQAAQLRAELEQLRQSQQAAAAAETGAELKAQNARCASLFTAYEGVKRQFLDSQDRERLLKIKYDEVIQCNRQMLQREERLHEHATELQERLKQGACEYKKLLKKLRDAQRQLQHQQQQQQQQTTVEPVEEFHDAIGGEDESEQVNVVTVIHRPPRVAEEPQQPLIALSPSNPDCRVCPLCSAQDFDSQGDYEKHVHRHFSE